MPLLIIVSYFFNLIMVQRGRLEIIWEGNLSLRRIKWGLISSKGFSQSNLSPFEINANWEEHLKNNPEDYNGNLVFLENFKQKGGNLFLNVDTISFSTVVYLAKHNITISKGTGMLGVQYLVFSPFENYFLIGERSINQDYYPGSTTLPGGMLEVKDLDSSPEAALLRELKEEVPLNVNYKASLIAIIAGWNGVSVTFLIKTKLPKKYVFNPSEIVASEKNEWLNGLRWISLSKFKTLSNDKILDGLLYLKSKV